MAVLLADAFSSLGDNAARIVDIRKAAGLRVFFPSILTGLIMTVSVKCAEKGNGCLLSLAFRHSSCADFLTVWQTLPITAWHVIFLDSMAYVGGGKLDRVQPSTLMRLVPHKTS